LAKVKLIAGLGNPGSRYADTRHNAGFIAIDVLLRHHGLRMGQNRYKSPFLSTNLHGDEVSFVKPSLYMNLSGVVIRTAMDELDIDRLLVIHDDIDIRKGEARYKTGGGHGGHNGLKSIIAELGSNRFERIRIGVGRPPEWMDPAEYVLEKFTEDEREPLVEAFDTMLDLVENRFLADSGEDRI